MKAIKIFFTILFLISGYYGYAQVLNLEVPIKEEAKIGEEFSVGLDVQGIKKYKIKMTNNPSSSYIKDNKFVWIPKLEEKNYYRIKFQLFDSLQSLVNEKSLIVTVDLSNLKPYLVFDRVLPDTIKVSENETFSFVATIKSRQNNDARSLMTFFTFNEDPDIRKFDSCRVNVNGDQLLFSWTPSNRDAVQGYIKFRITIIDADQSILNQVLNFKVKSVNQSPYFANQLLDTLYLQEGEGMTIDYSAIDPDNDKLTYDYSPKSSRYSLEGTTIIFKPESYTSIKNNLPIHLTLLVSDGKNSIKKNVCVLKDNEYFQPIIGDFTKKIFSEGDSILTYLNISNFNDLNQYDITYKDLSSPGTNSLAKYLIFENKVSYIKVSSKGIIPYYLVNKDYTYSISVTISSKDKSHKPSFKVLQLTIEDKPDPNNIGHQKDTLLTLMNDFLKVERIYKSSLEKTHSRTSKPWWKKVAIGTATLSGVLTLIQSQNSDKRISAISASISLISITVSNIPSLSEKILSELEEKISDSKARINTIQEKEAEFKLAWSEDRDQAYFDKIKMEISYLVDKNQEKRSEDICSVLGNKKLKRKIDKLVKRKTKKDENPGELMAIFK
ncbi:MAG TPA: hypothetical protein VNW06_13190, partial [Cytophagaceae bacterium]|nr:hypothetical protein [Cytophagaceae bacterium]